MSELDTLTQEFDRLLDGIRTDASLEEWQYAYRKIIFSGAMKLLENFPEIIIGPPPSPPPPGEEQGSNLRAGAHPITDGQPPPYRPSTICQLVCIVVNGNPTS